MTERQFILISKWQNETFGNATPLSKLAHLKEEIDELERELQPSSKPENLQNEFADCFILLFGAAASAGMTYENIVDCINEKMKINFRRKWGKPNAQGVINHIPE